MTSAADLARPGTIGNRTLATRIGSLVGTELITMLIGSPALAVEFARLQQCLVPASQIICRPTICIPLLIRLAQHWRRVAR